MYTVYISIHHSHVYHPTVLHLLRIIKDCGQTLNWTQPLSKRKEKKNPLALKWIAFLLWLDTLSYFHSSIYLSGRAFMCHFLLSFETSVETMVPLQHFLLFCLCSAKHDGTNEPIKRAGGCAVPGGKPRNWDGLISWKVGLTGDSRRRRLASGKLQWGKAIQ